MIGGSGEKKTLRMVAQYADASNFFGDAERMRHLIGVLERALRAAWARPSEITKTRLGTIVIAPTHEEASARSMGCAVRGCPSKCWPRSPQAIRDTLSRRRLCCSSGGSTG